MRPKPMCHSTVSAAVFLRWGTNLRRLRARAVAPTAPGAIGEPNRNVLSNSLLSSAVEALRGTALSERRLDPNVIGELVRRARVLDSVPSRK